MRLTEFDHQGVVEQTRREYASFYDSLRWVTPEAAERMGRERQDLLDYLSPRVQTAFKGTKPYTRILSPGCLLCGNGSWSCLFINNICNARCFYCPSEQNTIDEPGTSTLTFRRPDEYVEYLERFGFQGASISGGEPLMTFDRTLLFVGEIKRHFGRRMYLWLYTNGILATPDRLLKLRDAGLDEIRFNIGATDFTLDRVSLAVGVIPRVTIEIPAVPERVDLLARLMPEMRRRGVDFLNLHQIRCTAFNHPKLAARGYTFAHGPLIGVVESELAALRLVRHALDEGIDLGVNYCSLIYRHRFQTRAARSRWAPHLKKGHEDITETGMIRSISARCDEAARERIRRACSTGGADPAGMYESGDRLFFGRELLDAALPELDGIRVAYFVPSVHPRVTYRNPFREVRLDSGKTVVLERASWGPAIELDRVEAEAFSAVTAPGRTAADDPDSFLSRFPRLPRTPGSLETWRSILNAERLGSGLLEYY